MLKKMYEISQNKNILMHNLDKRLHFEKIMKIKSHNKDILLLTISTNHDFSKC